MDSKSTIASLLLRLGLGFTFLSAVAARLGLWQDGSGWSEFLEYTASVNSFAAKELIPFLAVTATVIEILIGLMLILGFKTRFAAFGATGLTLLFALTMSYSFGLRSAFDYSVFVDCTASFLLATISDYKWSLDQIINKKAA
ncbi:DoxX family protein [Chryseobacterium gleum]|uniref:DoxX family protein n=1 Tax=Chryseobacterium gleum TaxID=250 RepID=UPI0028B1DF0C|nr:DoxX family protein [Chryseobacterium gleum]